MPLLPGPWKLQACSPGLNCRHLQESSIMNKGPGDYHTQHLSPNAHCWNSAPVAFSRSSSVAGAGYWALTRMGQPHRLPWPELVYLHEPRVCFRAAAHHAYIWDFSLCPGLEYLGKLHVRPLLSLSQFCGHGYLIREFPILPSFPTFALTVEKTAQQKRHHFWCFLASILPPPHAPQAHTLLAVGELTSLSLRFCAT